MNDGDGESDRVGVARLFQPRDPSAMPPPIPVTIVTGFLGSGKTTLILKLVPQLLAKHPGYRLALLKNEFGDVAIDSQLAGASAIAGVRELLNGCICCNLVGQLGEALAELTDNDGVPDRIVIETSGSAFPATLALEVNRLARATGRYVLDGVISVIDVENWAGYDDTSYTARLQARFTDLLVLNKWETAGAARYDEVIDRIGDLDVDVAKVKSDRGCVPVDIIFGVDTALSRSLTEADDARGADPHDHRQEVEVLSVELRGLPTATVSADALLALLRAAPKDEVYRIKAMATLASAPPNSDADLPQLAPQHPPGQPRRYILNWAFGRWTFTYLPDTQAEYASSSQTSLHMTVMLARCEANKWQKRIQASGLAQLEAPETGALSVRRVL